MHFALGCVFKSSEVFIAIFFYSEGGRIMEEGDDVKQAVLNGDPLGKTYVLKFWNLFRQGGSVFDLRLSKLD